MTDQPTLFGTDELIPGWPLARYGWPERPRVGRIWTAQYQNPGIVLSELTPVRTTRGAPRFRLPYDYGTLTELAPPASTFRKPFLPPDQFRVVYTAMLEGIGQERIGRHLQSIREIGEADPVLLCFEDVRGGREWCHRLIFAEWWEDQTGDPVLELLDQPPVV